MELILSWEVRWLRIKAVVAKLQPDVITLQELDHMAQAQPDLAALLVIINIRCHHLREFRIIAVVLV